MSKKKEKNGESEYSIKGDLLQGWQSIEPKKKIEFFRMSLDSNRDCGSACLITEAAGESSRGNHD
jgi:hypothetical protein